MNNGGAARLQKRGRVVVIASALMMTTALAPVVMFAPDANAQVSAGGINAEHTFDIPTQSLTSALAQFGVQAGVQVTVDGALARGIDAPAINGSMRASTALEALLRGSGLDYDVTSDGTVVIEAVTSSAGEEVLDTLRVEANAAEASDPTNAITDSFVASRSRTASKTDTPILDDSSAVSVVTQKEMETRNVQDLQQAVAYTAGVQAGEYGSDVRYDYVRIRGFGQQNLGAYRDGLPSRIYNFTNSRPEAYGLQQVDVLKGSTSSLFGMNAPGGLVNMTTKRPQDEASGEVMTTFGENHLRGAGDVTGPVGENSNWSYRLTALWQDAERGQDYSQDDRIYVAPAFTYAPNADTKLTILTSYSDRESGLGYGFPAGIETSRDAFFGEPDFNNFDTEETNIGYELSHQINDKLEFRQNARYTHVDLTYETVYLNDTTPLGNRYAFAIYGELDRFAIDNQLQYDTAINDTLDSKTLVGLDYNRDQNRERRFDGTASPIDPYNPSYCGMSCIDIDFTSDTEITQAAYGLYAQEQLTIADDWIATVGGRFDYVQSDTDTISSGTTDERDDHKFTSRFGLTYKATNEVSVYGNYSESYQPVYSSLASRPDGVKPQEGTQYELGVKYQPEAIDALFTAAVFDLTQENVSQYDSGSATYKQIGEINSRGLELEGKMSLGEQTNMTVAYTFLDAEIKDDATAANIGNRPANVPKHQASAWLDYTIPGQGALGDLTLGGGVRFVGERQRNDGNTETLPSNSVFDAAINYAVTDDVSLSVNATNLFDREYVSSNTFGSRYYGEGRTVLATLKYSW
ncbi:TonB-dependent siderophore receptor [Thalassospira tepidiphila]|uniref:Ligand-gated channel protein n=2 Tax=Thalassospira tepidiphila TaxID=393657 RepID=A0A853KXJ6_9PROT|nr:TonB-dependent siderophore receptor [Thalassospira tepidiphila]NJB75813.1 iron complex outermembrane receptor protein [Thalassospira tepidiphila]OAZ08872.1 ligand-gated channel protein [Thalassospira tepidiphila MCCC 1A03514]